MSIKDEMIKEVEGNKNLESELFKIEETLKTAFNCSLCLIIGFLYFMIVVSITLFISPPEGVNPFLIPVIIIIIWAVIIPILSLIIPMFRGLRKKRLFLITDKKIAMKLPDKDPFKIPEQYTFQINWSEFDKIQVKKHANAMINIQRIYYNFSFLKEDEVVGVFEFESGVDFKVRSRKKIISNLHDLALKMNKECIGPKKQ